MYCIFKSFYTFSAIKLAGIFSRSQVLKIYVSHEEYIFTPNSLEISIVLTNSLFFTHFSQIFLVSDLSSVTARPQPWRFLHSERVAPSHLVLYRCFGLFMNPQLLSAGSFCRGVWKYSQEWAFVATSDQCRGTSLVLWQPAGDSCIIDETCIF